MERVGGFGGKADQLNAYYMATREPDYFEKDLARYRAHHRGGHPGRRREVPAEGSARRAERRAGGEEVNDRGFRDLGRSWLVLALSMRRRRGACAASPDRSKPPALGPAPALKLPAIQKRSCRTASAVWIVEQHEVPLAQVNLIVRSGSAADPIGKYGVGSLTAAMLDEGAGTRSSLELADALEFLGANLSTTSSFDYSAVRLVGAGPKLSDALPLMADVALRPTFPANELDRLRKERLTALLQARDNPAQLVQIGVPAHRVRPDPPLRHVGERTAAGDRSVHGRRAARVLSRALSSRQRDADRRRRRDAGGDHADARKGVRRVEIRRHGAAGRRGADGAATHQARQIYIVDKPDAAQSQIRIGWVGVPRSTPDYAALEVLNTILGGSFTSRLNQNLREKNGYTYGASSDVRHAPVGRARSSPLPACRPTRPRTGAAGILQSS